MGLSWLGGTQTELINRQIADNSPQGAQQVAFIQAMISEFEGSAAYKFMEVAQRYYENDPDIRDKKRTVIAKDMENNAVLKESKVLTNNKLQHNFMKKLTRQKIAYMLGKPFTLTEVKDADKEAEAFFDYVCWSIEHDAYELLPVPAEAAAHKAVTPSSRASAGYRCTTTRLAT